VIKPKPVNPIQNFATTRTAVGYVPRLRATAETYQKLGFRCGLEVHQQLKTKTKLFCRCPAGIYQKHDDYDAEIIRHMRPTLSELGEYDGTALMEFKTRKNITYRIKNETACTYEIDDTPPFLLNQDALGIAIEIALLLRTNIVGELHITRKQYLDGSIPTGFQRTAIVGIEGEIPLANKTIRIIQLSVEEDACREVSDIGHERIYTTDRLGIPLIETVTYPDMLTPDEAAEACQYLRFLARGTGKVNTGIGAAREDVNVSITGGMRVEIKGVSHIKWIPELTHNEAFRQKALLKIREILNHRVSDPTQWNMDSTELSSELLQRDYAFLKKAEERGLRLIAVNLPEFAGILSFFTQPGRTFADELSDRLKVIACLEKPNMTNSDALDPALNSADLATVCALLGSSEGDAQLILWGPEEDIKTALDTIEERCRLAFEGVPNETRKPTQDGTTLFERVLPGPDRMYPDTDSAPIPIHEALIETFQNNLPLDPFTRIKRLREWNTPPDIYTYVLKRNLFPLIERIIDEFNEEPLFVATLVGHTLRGAERRNCGTGPPRESSLIGLFDFVRKKGLERTILKAMVPLLWQYPAKDFVAVLESLNYQPHSEFEILSRIPRLRERFQEIKTSQMADSEGRWIMGQLRPLALGNMSLETLARAVDGG